MAQFYGSVQGSRGEASRLGGKESGLEVSATAWGGGVFARLWHEKGIDMIRACLRPHRQHGDTHTERCLYYGPAPGWKETHSQGSTE